MKRSWIVLVLVVIFVGGCCGHRGAHRHRSSTENKSELKHEHEYPRFNKSEFSSNF